MHASPASPKVRTRPRVRTLTVVVLLAVFAAPVQAADLVPTFIHQYGSGDLGLPNGVAIAPTGESYVTNSVHKRVEKYSKDGTHLLSIGSAGTGPGEFQLPYVLAVDPSGDLWVVDIQLSRVSKFTPGGVFLGSFGSLGTGDGQFDTPRGIAIDPAGNIYIADSFNHRIQRFSAGGVYVSQWNTGDGPLGDCWGIASDAAGDIYVADTYNHRIQKFTPDGDFLYGWGAEGTGSGQFEYPNAIDIDAGGNVYVCDANNRRVQRFTTTGAFVSKWGSLGSGPGQFQSPTDVAVSREGDVHVVDAGNHRVEMFRTREGSRHEFMVSWGTQGTGAGEFMEVRGLSFSPSGSVYVVDKALDRVQKFTSFGAWSGAWGTTGSGNGQFSGPVGVATDASGNVYVTEEGNARVQKFDASGNYLTQWGSLGTGPGQFTGIWDIAVDAADNVYVVDFNRVQKFTSSGGYVTYWEPPFPIGIGIDREGFVYVTCGDHKVRKYSGDGVFALEWGSQGTGPGQFEAPRDVVADSAGYVYVCDNSDRIQQFTARGGYVMEWGETGSDHNQMYLPTMMAADPAGNLFISEYGNARVQKLCSPPELVSVEDVPGDHGGSVLLRFRRSSAEAPGSSVTLTTYDAHRRLIAPPIWSYLGSVPADGVTESIVVASGDNATPTYNGMSQYRVWTVLAVPNTFPVWGTLYGYSADDLAYPVSVEPSSRVLSLEAIQPNPFVGRNLSVRFSLARDAEARVELMDVVGRRIAERIVKGAGRHEVAFAAERTLAPGVYWVRVLQGSNQIVRRFVALR